MLNELGLTFIFLFPAAYLRFESRFALTTVHSDPPATTATPAPSPATTIPPLHLTSQPYRHHNREQHHRWRHRQHRLLVVVRRRRRRRGRRQQQLRVRAPSAPAAPPPPPPPDPRRPPLAFGLPGDGRGGHGPRGGLPQLGGRSNEEAQQPGGGPALGQAGKCVSGWKHIGKSRNQVNALQFQCHCDLSSI